MEKDKWSEFIKKTLSDALSTKEKELDEREAAVALREDKCKKALDAYNFSSANIVKIHVGDRVFTTTAATLLSHEKSFFHGLLNPNFVNAVKELGPEERKGVDPNDAHSLDDEEEEDKETVTKGGAVKHYVIARDPEVFRYVLEFLTYGKVLSEVTSAGLLEKMKIDADFYGLKSMVDALENIGAQNPLSPAPYRGWISRYTTTHQMTNGYKQWQTLEECAGSVTKQGNNYRFQNNTGASLTLRISVRVNGSSSGANSDCIEIHVQGTAVHRGYFGQDTGYYGTVCLSDIITLPNSHYFEIYQQVNSHNLNTTQDNSLIVEKLA